VVIRHDQDNKEKIDDLSPERRQKVRSMVKQLMAEETMIRDLRLATAPGSVVARPGTRSIKGS
jgi:hypothetical protein